MRRLTVLAAALLLALLAVGMAAGTLAAQTNLNETTVPPQAMNVEDPLVQDAQWYASEQGVSLQEAVHRLRLQQGPIADLDAQLMANEPSTFAGLWIQHRPEFGVVARFTQGGEQTIRPYVEGGPLEGLVQALPASATFDELEAAQARASRLVDFLGVPAETGIDVRVNRAYVNVTNPARLNGALQTANLSLPREVEVHVVSEFIHPTDPIYAGFKIIPPSGFDCTTGFVVRHVINGDEGVTTAGHCDDAMYFRGTYLDKRNGGFYGPYDLQWHNTPGYEDRAWIRDGYNDSNTPGYRYVTGARGRLDQPVDSLVCHVGTGGADGFELKCGYIRDRSWRPNDPDYNSPWETFVLVRNEGRDIADIGDSGGPWFIGGTALGLQSCGSFDAACYMSITYFNDDGPEDFNLKVQQVD